jgi:hypothetical protein
MNSQKILFDAIQACIVDGIIQASIYQEHLINVKGKSFWNTISLFWEIYTNDPCISLFTCITENGQVRTNNLHIYIYIYIRVYMLYTATFMYFTECIYSKFRKTY